MKILNPTFKKIAAIVYGVGGVNIGFSKKLAQLHLLPAEKHCPKFTIQTLGLLHLTSYISPARPQKIEIDSPKLNLADPYLFSSQQIDLILSADKYGSCLLPGLQRGMLGTLTAQATVFGWILSDSVMSDTAKTNIPLTVHQSITAQVLHEDLTKFGELEKLPNRNPFSSDKKFCEEHFWTTHRRTSDGRYMARLPFNSGPRIKIGFSLFRAKIVLNKVLQRLSGSSTLFKEYSEISSEYERLGLMERVLEEELDDSAQVVYVPHHPVLRESSATTKLRVVFNASSFTSNNTSLNTHLHVGPRILNDLVSIILNWRSPCFMYMADIKKVFRKNFGRSSRLQLTENFMVLS